MYCISCKKDKVIPYDVKYGSTNSVKSEEELLWKNEINKRDPFTGQNSTINNEMVSDGIIHIIEASYGSKCDGDRFIIAICDDCIQSNLEDGTLLFFSGGYDYKHEQANIEMSKKILRRRKNLDGLI
jgi:hypothetical protein